MRTFFDKALIVLVIYFIACFGFILKFSSLYSVSSNSGDESESPIVIQISHKRYQLDGNSDTKKLSNSSINSNSSVQTNPNNKDAPLLNQSSGSEIVEDPLQLRIKTSNYDDKAGLENRLGFGIKNYILPKSWEDILDETYPKDSVQMKREPLKILLYDSFDWWKFDGSMKCSRSLDFPCEFKEREMEEEELDQMKEGQSYTKKISDAVVIVQDFHHGIETVKNFLEEQEQNQNKTVHRIYFTLESPFVAKFPLRLGPRRDFLASYWRGSDIYSPYFKWTLFDPQPTTPQQIQITDYAMGRTKLAATVISNCRAQNDRMDLVKELQKYIQVDVYGNCGIFDCLVTPCFQEIKNTYKFYLAFENSNCRDYITEKMHQNAFENNLVPVVFGAHPDDYKAIAPPNSYIHVEDFPTVQDLANYLELLNSNDTLYNEYFAWKSQGEFRPINFLCQLCAFLHLENIDHENKQQSANELELGHEGGQILQSDIVSSDTNNNNNENNNDNDNENGSGIETKVSYLNQKDSYKIKEFQWTSDNQLMCLPSGQWFWNKRLKI